mgnify:CR=1 FL=1
MNVIYAENQSGCIKGNCTDGKGTYTYPPWVEQRKYVGEMVNESPHGSGTMYYKTGSEWTGTWELGAQEKKKQVRIKMKNKKTGCQSGNCKNGKGTFLWVDGRKYTGQHNFYKANGQGEYTHMNGAVYTGSFKNGQKHGNAIMHYQDGDIYNGKWSYGELILETPPKNYLTIDKLLKKTKKKAYAKVKGEEKIYTKNANEDYFDKFRNKEKLKTKTEQILEKDEKDD